MNKNEKKLSWGLNSNILISLLSVQYVLPNNLLLDFSFFQWGSVFGYCSWWNRKKNKKNKVEYSCLSMIWQCRGLSFHLKTYIQLVCKILNGGDYIHGYFCLNFYQTRSHHPTGATEVYGFFYKHLSSLILFS